MPFLRTLVLALLFAQPALAQAPVDAIAQAHADLLKLPPEIRQHVRYLSLYNLPALERPKAIQVLAGHCNGLSREADLTPPAIVPGTHGALLRVNLLDYRWSVETWEKLEDPYFTIRLNQVSSEQYPVLFIAPENADPPAKKQPQAPQQKQQAPKQQGQQALAPWLTETVEARKNLAGVIAMTQSRIPVVRGDWFFNQTAAAAERSPNYYDFLGVKDEKTFQLAIGADLKLAEQFGAELRESVALSGVTLQPRAIARHPTLGGGYWRTFDFKTAKGEKNPLRVLGKDIEKVYDATEQFGTLPNGLWATGLFDRAGKAQATAPDDIASDGSSRSNDRRVHVNVSCMRCHTNGGLQDIDGWVRNLLTPPLELRSSDYQRVRELRRAYARKLEPALTKDRLTFEEAVKEVTGGMDGKTYSRAYAEFWERYEDGKIDLVRAALDLGVSEKHWRAALDAKVKAGTGDTVLSAMLLANPRLNRIPIRVWEDLYQEAQLTLRGYQPP